MRLNFSRFSKTAGEIKRRKVFRVASVYVITAATLAALAADILPTFGASDWAVRMTVSCLFLGLPIAIALAWIYELSPDGVRVDPGIVQSQDTITFFSNGKAHLSVSVEKNGKWETRSFNNSFTLGRSPGSDICINKASVSRQHAKVSFENGEWILEDLGSRNGTKLNGGLISRVPLPEFAEIKLSDDGANVIIRNNDLDDQRTVMKPTPERTG